MVASFSDVLVGSLHEAGWPVQNHLERLIVMNEQTWLVLMVAALVVVVFGVWLLLLSGDRRPYSMGRLWLCWFGVILMLFGGWGFIFSFCGRAASQRVSTRNVSTASLSTGAQMIQQLLRGEEMPLRGSTLPEVYATLARDLGLPETNAWKLGDIRRYTIRFNTNDAALTATNH